MHPRELINAFQRGENITSLLRKSFDTSNNTEEIIETAYDLQTGGYVAALDAPQMLQHKVDYGNAIAQEILSLTKPRTLLEAGIGEGTTCSFVLDGLNQAETQMYGFDISWSRIACCRDWFERHNYESSFLSVASLFHLPYADESFDVVYTSHSIEPNRGKEAAILQELYRVTSGYLILLEPGYELASLECQQRMEQHGYCRELVAHAQSLDMQVTKHELFPYSANPLNPTAITLIVKNTTAQPATAQLVCPRFHDPLVDYGDSLYSSGSLRAYPKIQNIPCLRPEDGIITSAYEQYRKV